MPKKLTVNQQRVEEWINNHEEQGKFLLELGLITQAELDEAIAEDEELRLTIEADPAEADRVVAEETEG